MTLYVELTQHVDDGDAVPLKLALDDFLITLHGDVHVTLFDAEDPVSPTLSARICFQREIRHLKKEYVYFFNVLLCILIKISMHNTLYKLIRLRQI